MLERLPGTGSRLGCWRLAPPSSQNPVQWPVRRRQRIGPARHGRILDQRRSVVRLDAGVDHHRSRAAPAPLPRWGRTRTGPSWRLQNNWTCPRSRPRSRPVPVLGPPRLRLGVLSRRPRERKEDFRPSRFVALTSRFELRPPFSSPQSPDSLPSFVVSSCRRGHVMLEETTTTTRRHDEEERRVIVRIRRTTRLARSMDSIAWFSNILCCVVVSSWSCNARGSNHNDTTALRGRNEE